MLALYVYTSLLPGRKLLRAHAGPFERCRNGRGVDTVLVFIRQEMPRHLRGVEGAELLRGQGPRLLRPWRCCVEGSGNRNHRPPLIDLRRSRRPADSRQCGAKPTQRAELHPPNKHIHHQEVVRIETRCRRQNKRSERRAALRISSRSRLPRLDELQQ